MVPAELEHKVLRYSGDADLIVCDDIRGGTFSSLRCFSPSATSVGPEEPPAAVTKAASGSKKESEDRARVCEERSKSKKRKRSHSAQGRHDIRRREVHLRISEKFEGCQAPLVRVGGQRSHGCGVSAGGELERLP